MQYQHVRFKLRVACFHQLSFVCINAIPTRKVQTARSLFSPTIVSNRRFSSDRAKKYPYAGYFYFWWPWSDSNRHSLQNLILSQARLPIPPRGQNRDFILQQIFWLLLFLPTWHYMLPYVQAFSQAFLLFQLSFQSLS